MFVLPQSISCDVVDIERRPAYTTIFETVQAVATGMGPLLGGVFADTNWRCAWCDCPEAFANTLQGHFLSICPLEPSSSYSVSGKSRPRNAQRVRFGPRSGKLTSWGSCSFADR
jgi:hypothetical protein